MSRSARRGSFANTAVWSCAVLAIAGLTVWKFEIWPVGWVATETGTIDPAPDAEQLAAAPIAVASAADAAPPQVEPAAGTLADHAPPPAELATLNIDPAPPEIPDRSPPAWPTEPNRLPAPRNAKPLRSAAAPLAGSDFSRDGAFPEAAPTPPRQMEPVSIEAAPSGEVLRPTGGEKPAAPIVPSSAEIPAASPGARVALAASETPVAPAAADPRLAAIDADITAGRVLAAHKALSKLYWNEPGLRPAIATRIDATARSIYFDPQPHYMPAYEVAPGDQFRVFARQYNVPWEYLARLNRIDDPSRVKAGQRIKVIKGPFSAVVDLSDFVLTIHAHGYYVRRYPVGVGKDGSTPIGTFHVLLKETNPKYYGPDVVMERDDPQNPLGERWVGLDDGTGQPSSYGIHGTIEPGSIGKAASRGCVRLRNEDVAEVYDLLGVGSEVAIQR